MVLGDPLDGLDQIGRDGVGQTVPLLYLLQDGNEHHQTRRVMCMCSGQEAVGVRREVKGEKAIMRNFCDGEREGEREL